MPQVIVINISGVGLGNVAPMLGNVAQMLGNVALIGV